MPGASESDDGDFDDDGFDDEESAEDSTRSKSLEALCRVLAANTTLRALDVTVTAQPPLRPTVAMGLRGPSMPPPPNRSAFEAQYGRVAEALAGNCTLRAFAISGVMCVRRVCLTFASGFRRLMRRFL